MRSCMGRAFENAKFYGKVIGHASYRNSYRIWNMEMGYGKSFRKCEILWEELKDMRGYMGRVLENVHCGVPWEEL